MADCSKTEVFLAETDRMCDDCGEDFRNIYHEFCPIKLLCQAGRYNRKTILDEASEFVQKWSDEHPAPKPKTYADDFFEKFPNATRYRCGEMDVPYFCVDNFYGLGKRSSCNLKCHSCWNEPYKEDV